MARAALERRLDGMTSLGNRTPVSGSMGLFLLVEKSPERSAAVGSTWPELTVALFSRSDSHEKNRKVLSFMIGPPRLAPNWFRLSTGLGVAWKNCCASRW